MFRRAFALIGVLAMLAAACGDDEPAATKVTPTTTTAGATTTTAGATTTAAGTVSTVQDVLALDFLTPLEPGTYSIDPDVDASTRLRVVFEVPTDGWTAWHGALKGNQHVGVGIMTVSNLVRHGCSDHSPADPPVGSSVDDLAAALADLAPFRVTSPPEDVTIYGYSGKHLELIVPEDLPRTPGGDFTGCVDGNVASWFADVWDPSGPFFGYGDPGRSEEFWILDVDGTRLVINATWVPGSPPDLIAEMRTILGSIRIDPHIG